MGTTKTIGQNPNSVKRWFNIKGEHETTWTAYNISRETAARLKPEYKIRGPFMNLLQCLIESSSKSL